MHIVLTDLGELFLLEVLYVLVMNLPCAIISLWNQRHSIDRTSLDGPNRLRAVRDHYHIPALPDLFELPSSNSPLAFLLTGATNTDL